jgi:hypothetical protein
MIIQTDMYNVGDVVKSNIQSIKISSTASYNNGNGCMPVFIEYCLKDMLGTVVSLTSGGNYIVRFCTNSNCNIHAELNKNQIYLHYR